MGMTAKEAIMGLERLAKYLSGYKPNKEMFEMAISALQEQEAKAQLSAEGTTNLRPTCNQLATDCISRQAAIDVMFSEPLFETGMKKRSAEEVVPALFEKIKVLPSVQPERKTGKWIDTDNYYMRWKCSLCGCHTRDAQPAFCPHCGAHMTEVDDKNESD